MVQPVAFEPLEPLALEPALAESIAVVLAYLFRPFVPLAHVFEAIAALFVAERFEIYLRGIDG